MVLAENRVPFGAICVPEEDFENNKSQVWFIATQLRYYLARITIAPFEVKINDDQNGIYVKLDASLKTDEFSIKTKDGSIYITGGKRGVIYGGYEFLERLGCRFFTPDCEKIPTLTTLKIDELDIVEKPTFEFRDTDYSSIKRFSKFATMCRINGRWNDIPEMLGGSIRYALGAHSFAVLVPHKEYRDTHPEYFSFYNGRRQSVENDHWQLCLTNPELIDIVVENARKILKENPDRKILSISQNDNPYSCQCENCLKSDAEEGSPVGTLIKFVNRVAEILEPEFPDVTFDILAYHYTRPASKKTQTRHNVCVRLCASCTCFAHPFDKCDDRSRAQKRPDGKATLFIEDLMDWSRVCERLYVWDYTSNFPLYPMPFPNWRVLKPNLQTMAKYNVKGVFEEANCAYYGGVDFNELRTYLISKLLWNPDCDIDAHRKEFMEYFYGAAAEYLDEYLNMLCDFVEKENYHMYIQDTKRPDYLSDELLAKYNELFDKAQNAVAGDGVRLMRVERARLSIRFADIFWNEVLSGNYDAQKINQFFTDLRAHNISRIDEWSNIERTYRAWMDGKERGIVYTIPWRYDAESIL
ncbi:MAG: DUF4838 domain-containing protein [Clostridia bacterium]|nr:DUF4838 domain-containing protein [Clostridia bacterium]